MSIHLFVYVFTEIVAINMFTNLYKITILEVQENFESRILLQVALYLGVLESMFRENVLIIIFLFYKRCCNLR